VRISYGAKTDTGLQRAKNEDNYLVDPNLQIFVLCDGMGGHAGGATASSLAVQEVHDFLTRQLTPQPPDTEGYPSLIAQSIAHANRRIYEHSLENPEVQGMGTTLSMVLIQGARAYVGHVGDSRVYLIRSGHTHQITDDHSFIGEMMRHGGTRNILDVSPKLRNAITRAVGTREHVDSDGLEIDLLPGDRILLCSDGLHGYADPATLHRLTEGGDEPKDVCDQLVAYANEAGGKDNITVIMIEIHETPEWDGQEMQQNLKALRAMKLFRHLSYSELLKVLHVAEERVMQQGETLFETGAVEDAVYAILSGQVTFHQESKPVSVLTQGHHFGELALVDTTPRSVDAVAIEETRLLVLKRTGFYTLLRGDTQVAIKLLWSFVKSLTIRLHSMSDRLALGESLYRTFPNQELDTDAPHGWLRHVENTEVPPPLPLPPSPPKETE